MKKERLAKIREIIACQVVTTQEDLAEALGKEGFEVTQATVSRDIKEMGLIKTPAGADTYRYSLPRNSNIGDPERMRRMLFTDAVVTLDYSENIIVIKVLPGTAQGIAAVIDRANWPEAIGTVAGDDTILIVVKPKEKTAELMEKFRSFLS